MHELSPSSKELLACKICHKTFKTLRELSVHQEDHSSDLFSCHTCSKTFAFADVLIQHQKTHLVKLKVGCTAMNLMVLMKK